MRRQHMLALAAFLALTAAACSRTPTDAAARAPSAPAATCSSSGGAAADTTCRGGPYTGGGN